MAKVDLCLLRLHATVYKPTLGPQIAQIKAIEIQNDIPQESLMEYGAANAHIKSKCMWIDLVCLLPKGGKLMAVNLRESY